MADAPPIRGSDRPPVRPPDALPRGDLPDLLLRELHTRSAALLRGPPGAGTSWLAMDVATRWSGPVVWTRPGVLWHLGDLGRSLWSGPTPESFWGLRTEALVALLLRRIADTGTLWVLDDLDDALDPPPGPATPRDPDLSSLFAALSAGALRAGAVLLVGRRDPHGLDLPLHPLPPLPLHDAARLGRQDPSDLDPAWGARPGALPLLANLPEDEPLPSPKSPFGALVAALARRRLSDLDREVLLALSASPIPVPLAAVVAASGVDADACRPGLLRLLNLGLVHHRGVGWWTPRFVASAARSVLPELLPGVLPRAGEQRLAGWFLRQGVDGGADWEDIDGALPSRLGLRLCQAAGDPRMAIQTARFGHYLTILERLGASRALRDDLGVALLGPLHELDAADIAWARLARAQAATRIGDAEVAESEVVLALPEAERAGDPRLLREAHTALARRVLLSGDPATAAPHLKIALALARTDGDDGAISDLENQRGAIALQAGRLDEAQEAFTRSLEAAHTLGDARRAAAREAALGGVAMYRGALREAERRLTDATAAGRQLGDLSGVGHRLANLALVRSLRSDLRGALSAVGEALACGGGIDARSASRLLCLRGNLRRLAGDLDGALTDLDEAEELVLSLADREGLGQLQLARGHWLRTAGRYAESMASCAAATESLAASRDDGLRAAWEIEGWNSGAWAAAERAATGTGDGIADLLEVSALAKEALARIAERPFTPRWLVAFQQATECELLAATTTGMLPHGLARRLESAWTTANADEERLRTGEPALRCNLAWALRLCGHRERAAAEAQRAGLEAGRIGLATVRGRALAVRRVHELPAWNRQALLLDRLLTLADPG